MLGGEGGGWEAIHFRVTKQLLCSLGLFFFFGHAAACGILVP